MLKDAFITDFEPPMVTLHTGFFVVVVLGYSTLCIAISQNNLQFSLSPPNSRSNRFRVGRASKWLPLVISTSFTLLGSLTITHQDDPSFIEKTFPYFLACCVKAS